jgi:hypothetical protein
MINYTDIKAIANKLKIKVADLLCLAPANDPFYVGRPAMIEMAEWAGRLKKVWLEKTRSIQFHIRRFHYYLVSLGNVKRPNGTPYLNTDACWSYVGNAVKYARYLGHIDMSDVEDKKNKEIQNAEYWEDRTFYEVDIQLKDIAGYIANQYGLLINPQNHQPYHLEIWVEKDTMADVINPIAEKYGVDLVIGAGEISLTKVSQLYEKAQRLRKPIRIFYISDFDPKGADMPISIGRKIEWFIRKGSVQYDIKLCHLLLTREQCVKYRLPRVPIKTSAGSGSGAKAYNTRVARFQKAYGQGATELDALEALHPGEMSRIIEEAVRPYWDEDVAVKISEFNRKMVTSVYSSILDQGEILRKAIKAVDLSAAKKLYDGFEIPRPVRRLLNEGDFLFSADRSYLDQLLKYKEIQGKNSPFKTANLHEEFTMKK